MPGMELPATARSSFPGFSDRTNANYTANEVQVFGEVAYGLHWNGIVAEPFGDLAFVHLGTNSFTEAGGASALSSFGGSSDIGYSTFGARLTTRFVLPNGMVLSPWASAGWEHAIGAVSPDATLAFTSGGAFNIQGAPLARDAALLQIGADLRILPQATIGINYSGQVAGNANDQSVKGTFTWQF